MTEFDVLDAVCVAGRRVPNEDSLGWAGRFAWVLDGATPLSDRGLRAHEWSRALSSALARLAADAATPEELMGRALPVAAEACGWSEDASLESHELVSAGGVLALAGEGGVSLLSWGDCEAAVLSGSGRVRRVADRRLTDIDRETRVALAELRGQGDATAASEARWREAYVVPARCRMNAEGGYPILSPDGCGLAGGLSTFLPAARRVLLFSDGLAWGMDEFGLFTPAELLGSSLSLGEAVRLLREAEGADAARNRVVRFKVSDDATGLLLASREG